MPISQGVRDQAIELLQTQRSLLTRLDQQRRLLADRWLFVPRNCWACSNLVNAADAGTEEFSFDTISNEFTCPRCSAPLADGVPAFTTQAVFWSEPKDLSKGDRSKMLLRAGHVLRTKANRENDST